MRVLVRMENGDRYVVMGYASDVAEKVNAARGSGKLISLERDCIPAGQMVHLDPDLVMSIVDRR